MKSGRGLLLISIAAGAMSWVLNAVFEWVIFSDSGKTFLDFLVHVPLEELFDRLIAILAFLVFGIIVSRIYEKRLAAEEKLKIIAAELQRSNRELEQFASIVSHDLKEPLVTVGGFLGILKRRSEGNPGAEENRYIRYALESVERMQRLISDLLEYSRVATQPRPLQRLDSGAALDFALKNLEGPLQSQGVLVTRDPLPEITADFTQIAQLFQNLVSNAGKFCRQETPQVHISSVRSGKGYLFSVRDNGIGIATEHLEEIFKAFRRLHDGTGFPGSGLGLATCARIVERHCGRIWVDSKPGGGSTFYFTIPDRDPDCTTALSS